jgi:hypothetical protein
MANKTQRKIVAVRLSLAIIIAIGLSAIYWFPAMTTQESISMDAIITEQYDYANNFLFTGPKVGHVKNFWRILELLTVMTGGLAICAWKISQKYSEVTSRSESNYWIIVAMLSLFMTLPLSKLVWDVLPVIHKIQFPWRFNTILTVATVGLFTQAISQLKINYNLSNNLNKNLLFQIISYLAVIVFILTVILIIPLQGRITFWGSRNTVLSLSLIAFLLLAFSFIKKPINFFSHKLLSVGLMLTLTIFSGGYCYSLRNIFFARTNDADLNNVSWIKVSQAADEHRPRWVPKEVFNAKDLARLSEEFPVIQIDSEKASHFIRRWQPRTIVLQINATTNTEVTIHQFYYPGWTAKLKGSSLSLPIHFSELGLLQISVPTGKHEVSLTLDAVIEEKIGQIISVVSAMLTLFLVFLLRRDCSSMQHNKCMHQTD